MKFVNQIIREAISRTGHRHPCRAARKRSAHPVPHRRHPARGRRAAAVAAPAIVDHLAPESHGAHGHRGKAAAAGRAHQSRRGGEAIDVRVSTIPTVNGESISPASADPGEQQQFGFERLDLSAAAGGHRAHAAGAAKRHRACHGPDRLGKIDFALFASSRASTPCSDASSPSRSPWNTGWPAYHRST